ncbi:MAG: GGDEF domain-containing protein [Acidimicrobiia bacterium]
MNDSISTVLECLDRVPMAARLAIVAVYVLAVVVVDLATGPDLYLSVVYALAAMAAAWLVGWRAALVTVAVVWVAGFVVNVAAEREQSMQVILANHVLRLLSFVVLTALTFGARSSIASLLVSTRIDAMTGVLNQRGFLDELERARRAAVRTGEPLAVVYFDLDGLKQVNDRDGRAAGDALIRRFADRVGRHLRASDPFGRLGGDEFALVLERADPASIDLVIGRILDDPGLPSVSCGIQVFHGSYPPATVMLAGADRRMYADKRGRRGGRPI